MERRQRTCAVCRSSYKFCNLCREDSDKPLWYFTFCSENCKDIYSATSKFANGQLDAYEAKNKLDKLDLSKFNNFGNSYQKSIEKIMSSVIKIKEVGSLLKANDETIEENVEDVIIEKESIKKPRNKKDQKVE